jgi:hypothetical protein
MVPLLNIQKQVFFLMFCEVSAVVAVYGHQCG